MRKLLLFAASLLLTTGLMAQMPTVEDFHLVVNGVDVTMSNAANVFEGVEDLDGKVSFDLENRELTLDNVTLEQPIIVNPSSDELAAQFTIHVIGSCFVRSNDGTAGAIYAQVNKLIIYSKDDEDGVLHARASHETYPVHGVKVYRGGAKALEVSNLKFYPISNNSGAIEAGTMAVWDGTLLWAETEKAGEKALSIYDPDNNIALGDNVERFYPSSKDWNAQSIVVAPKGSEEPQGVIINGVPVTQYNMWDPLEDASLRLIWEPSTRYLYVYNMSAALTINPAPGVNGIEFQVPATMYFVPESQGIQLYGGAEAYAIKTNSDLTIQWRPDAGSVNIANPAGKVAIALEPGDEDITLTFDGANIESIVSDEASIAKIGTGSGKADIVVKESQIMLNSNIKDIDGLELIGSSYEGGADYILQDGVIFDPAMSMEAATPIHIVPEEYPVFIDGVAINAFNKDDIFGDGLASYDPEKHILALKEGADIHTLDNNAIKILGDMDFTIIVEGEVELYSENAAAIKFQNGGGGHKLTIIQNLQWKAFVMNTNNAHNGHGILDAYGNTVEFKGNGRFEMYAINDINNDSHMVWASTLILNAPLYVYTDNTAYTNSLFNVGHFELNEGIMLEDPNMEVKDNVGVVWTAASGKTDPIREVYFMTKPLALDLYVAGVEVNALNAADILGNGKVSYDDATHTLTLDHARIDLYEHPYTPGIFVSGGDLTIALKGENEISCRGASAITAMNKLTIKGAAEAAILKLFVDGDYGMSTAVYVEENLHVLEGAAVEIQFSAPADVNSVALNCGGAEGLLEVDNADLRAFISEYDATAIRCQQLIMGAGVDFRHDEAQWAEPIEWNAGSMEFVNPEGYGTYGIWIGISDDFPMQVENFSVPADKAIKVIRDGQLLILRGDKVYSITGAQIQ